MELHSVAFVYWANSPFDQCYVLNNIVKKGNNSVYFFFSIYLSTIFKVVNQIGNNNHHQSTPILLWVHTDTNDPTFLLE